MNSTRWASPRHHRCATLERDEPGVCDVPRPIDALTADEQALIDASLPPDRRLDELDIEMHPEFWYG